MRESDLADFEEKIDTPLFFVIFLASRIRRSGLSRLSRRLPQFVRLTCEFAASIEWQPQNIGFCAKSEISPA